ncbi:MAG: sugar transferase [FCB group bacterium]|nr:sugar transferase [FCB group bacterium]
MSLRKSVRLNQFYYLTLLVSDTFLIALSLFCALLLRFGTLQLPMITPLSMLLTFIFFFLITQVISMLDDLYSVRSTVNKTMTTFRIIRLVTISMVLYIFMQFLLHSPEEYFIISRLALLYFMFLWIISMLLFRILIMPSIYCFLLRLFRFGKITICIFGESSIQDSFIRLLNNSLVYRYLLTYIKCEDELPVAPDDRFDFCMKFMKENNGNEFLMIFTDESVDTIATFAMLCNRVSVPFILFSKEFLNLKYFDSWLSTNKHGALVFCSEKWTSQANFLWRMTDILLSIIGIIIFSPVMLFTALVVKLTSKGPVLFVRNRVGKDKSLFKFYKFRSMWLSSKENTEMHQTYFKEYAEGTAAEKSKNGTIFKKTSSAVTPIGRVIRKTSIDELPQLFNVLSGDMSMVGPRPCIEYEMKYYDSKWLNERFSIKPGLTGIWQIYGRSRIAFKDAQFLDFIYTISRTDGLNIRLILKTLPVMMSGKGGL